jgi:hypothetical protein
VEQKRIDMSDPGQPEKQDWWGVSFVVIAGVLAFQMAAAAGLGLFARFITSLAGVFLGGLVYIRVEHLGAGMKVLSLAGIIIGMLLLAWIIPR